MSRILHVLDHSLPLHSGYTFRTRAIMKAQAEAGWDVAGITGVRQYQHGLQVDRASETVEALTFYRTMSEASGPSPLREWREVAVLADAIVALNAEWPIDLLHAHSPALNGLAALRVSRRLGIPFVYEIRAFWEDAAVGNGTGTEGSAKYRTTRALENHVVRKADAVVVICDGLRRDLIDRGVPASKIVVSPNGVDLELFGSPKPTDFKLAAELGLADQHVIGFIGSFYDYEGIDDLIAALPLMRHDVQLLLVGGGPMEGALRAQAGASPAASRIHFAGRVPHDEVERYYSLVDILAYPRKKMRLTDLVTPLKPLEAMAQGRLVAASDVGGHKELISDGDTGTLFAADNPAAIAKALDGIIDKPADWFAMRLRARDFVETERNWAKNIDCYDPVYHSLLGKNELPKLMTMGLATLQEADMRNILPDNQMRALTVAMASAVVAAVGTMFVPVGVLEGLTGSTGISEIIGVAKPPLGDTARAMIAFGAGALTLAVLVFILLRQKQPAPFGGDDHLAEEKPSMLRGLVSKIEMPKMLWVKGEDDITELSDLPKLKNGDSHPDAPPRRPLSAQDLSFVEQTEIPVIEAAASSPVQPAANDVQDRQVNEPTISADPAPAIARVPAEDFQPSLAEMVAQLEAAVAERKKQLADLEIVAAQLGASSAAMPRPEPSATATQFPPLEAVPSGAAKDEHMDDALASALATLHRMNDGDR